MCECKFLEPKEFIMKNFVIALMLLITGTTFANASCLTGSCSKQPVRRVGTAVVDTTRRIVTAPFRVVNKARVNRINRLNAR